MTLALTRVELSNIRSHKHFVFEPEDEGITAISGPNGSGKSTLVDSVAWTLYGTKPQGVSRALAIYREGAVFPDDKCYARVDLEVDGLPFRIERRMVSKQGGVECEVFEEATLDDGTQGWKNVAGPAVSHAEPYIRKLLRMDEKGFLAAILIQQKQVDQLISASPRERAAVIEKLTGIASVTAAVTESRQEYNSLKKMVSFSTVNEDELENLKKDHKAMEEDLRGRTAHFNVLVSEEKKLKKSGAELKEKVETEAAKLEAVAESKTRVVGLKATVEAREAELSRLLEEKNERKKRLSSLSTGTSLEEVSAKLEELRSDVSSCSEGIYSRKSTQAAHLKNVERYEEILGKSRVKELAEAQKGLASQEAKVTALQSRREELSREVSTVDATMGSLSKAIYVISESHGQCPTCLQKVEDVKTAVDSLASEKAELEAKKEELVKEQEKAAAALATAREAVEKFGLLIEAIEGLATHRGEAEELEKALNDLAGRKRALEAELKSTEKVYNELKANEEQKNEYQRLLDRAQAMGTEVEGIKREILQLESQDIATITPAALAKLRKELDAARNDYMRISGELSEEKGEIRLQRERLKHLGEKIEDQEKAIERHKELLKSVEVAASSATLLEEFRTNRIESSIPLIEAYASDLLARFTEGKFTRLRLDGKFNASVVLADGNERAIGLLSGGELSAASMSLRLAISMLLNGGSSQSLIILDEVLVSQDSSRAELILSTVKEVCRGQVVLIAHNDSINDVSDKVVELV